MHKNTFKALMISGATLLGLAAPAFSTTITVPDGTFNSTTNVGSIGGSLLNLNATNAAIGSTGPWLGSYTGVLSLIAPPTLTLSNVTNTASIGGLASANVLGLLYNGGDFTTSVPTAYAANTVYTLTANVSAGTLLGVTALATDGVGIALTNGGSILASSASGLAPVTLTLLSGNLYTLTLQYTSPVLSGPTGPIGIELFDIPNNTATASVLSGVAFSNVTLDGTVVGSGGTSTPEPAAFLLSGAGLIAVGFIRRRQIRSRN